MSRAETIAKKSVGYWSALGGCEVKELNDAFCVCVSGAWCSKKSVHRVRVRCTKAGRPYVVVNGLRLHLDECIRC